MNATSSTGTDTVTIDPENPWLGLFSYSEESSPYFQGREEETAELARRVQNKLLTVLFGQSGLGKTSLLHAGLVPRLRAEGYCPVYVRIDYAPGSPAPSEQIKRAVFRAIGLLDLPERPLTIEAVRRGAYSGRNTDVSCVLDLMIHDIDLALTLAGSPPSEVSARGRVTEGPFADEARAELAFEDGLVAVLEASRIAGRRERTMRLVFPSGELEIDFLARKFVDHTPFGLDARFAETADGRDPLGASVGAFVAAVRGDAPRPLVTGEEAARALEVALEVDRKAAARPKLRLVRN